MNNLPIFLTGLVLALAGCSTERGASNDAYNTSANNAEAYPEPAGSPTARPGMTPRDPRDPQFITQPEPSQSPPTTKP